MKNDMFEKLQKSIEKKGKKKFMEVDPEDRNRMGVDTEDMLKELADVLGADNIAMHLETEHSSCNVYYKMEVGPTLNMYESAQNRLHRAFKPELFASLGIGAGKPSDGDGFVSSGAAAQALAEALKILPPKYQKAVMEHIKKEVRGSVFGDMAETKKDDDEKGLLDDLLK